MKIYVDAELEWAKVFEANRDLGEGAPEEIAAKLAEKQGQYSVTLILTEESKEKLLAGGVSNKGLHGQLWKQSEDGRPTYVAKRPHYNPNINEHMGPPKVVYTGSDGELKPWDFEVDGPLGNGTKARVGLDVWSKKGKSIVTLTGLRVIEHVPYTAESNDEGF